MDDVGLWASSSHALPAPGPIISLSWVVARMTIHLQHVVPGVALYNSPTQMKWGGFQEQNAFLKKQNKTGVMMPWGCYQRDPRRLKNNNNNCKTPSIVHFQYSLKVNSAQGLPIPLINPPTPTQDDSVFAHLRTLSSPPSTSIFQRQKKDKGKEVLG